jgi:thiol-disulfide isomerase/thioredoxin
MTKTCVVVGSILGLIVLAIAFSSLTSISDEPKNLDDFAKCLTEKGATFYGAEWCGHCKTQKESFGDSLQHINYVECASPNGQAKECSEAGVQAYPTWKFADGSIEMGFQEHEELAEKTGCEL